MIKKLFLLLVMLTIIALSILGAEIASRDQIPPISKRNLKIRFKALKTEHLELEPIFITSWVENFGNEIEYCRNEEVEQFEVRNEQGDLARLGYGWFLVDKAMTDFVPGVGDGDFRAIKPHTATTKGIFNVLDNYGVGKGFFDFYLEAGTYTVTAKGVRSDTVVVKIYKPKSAEDTAAVEALKRAAADATLYSYEAQYQFYSGFLAKYPNSVLAQRALRRLLFVKTYYNDPLKTQLYALQLITQFPESGFVQEAFADLDSNLLTDAQKKILRPKLQHIIEHFGAAHVISGQAKMLLEKVDK